MAGRRSRRQEHLFRLIMIDSLENRATKKAKSTFRVMAADVVSFCCGFKNLLTGWLSLSSFKMIFFSTFFRNRNFDKRNNGHCCVFVNERALSTSCYSLLTKTGKFLSAQELPLSFLRLSSWEIYQGNFFLRKTLVCWCKKKCQVHFQLFYLYFNTENRYYYCLEIRTCSNLYLTLIFPHFV